MRLIVASRSGTLDVARARREGRPVMLVIGGTHAGEIDGKDAGLMLLRDLAFGGKATLLDGATFLFVPILVMLS
jgi:hypothetical protein